MTMNLSWKYGINIQANKEISIPRPALYLITMSTNMFLLSRLIPFMSWWWNVTPHLAHLLFRELFSFIKEYVRDYPFMLFRIYSCIRCLASVLGPLCFGDIHTHAHTLWISAHRHDVNYLLSSILKGSGDKSLEISKGSHGKSGW